MKGESPPKNQLSLFQQRLEEQLNPKHPYTDWPRQFLGNTLRRNLKSFTQTKGRPAKPIRLMVGLLILKQLRNLSDERVVEE